MKLLLTFMHAFVYELSWIKMIKKTETTTKLKVNRIKTKIQSILRAFDFGWYSLNQFILIYSMELLFKYLLSN